jgi:hypothetical protein
MPTVTAALALPSLVHTLSFNASWPQHQLATGSGTAALDQVFKHTLKPFQKAAQPSNPAMLEEESTSIVNSGCVARTRGSLASVLEMMSTTLAVVPSRYQQHGHGPVCSTPRAVRRHHPFLSLYSDSRSIYAFFRDRNAR